MEVTYLSYSMAKTVKRFYFQIDLQGQTYQNVNNAQELHKYCSHEPCLMNLLENELQTTRLETVT